MSDPKPAYELTFEERDGYLYALVRADEMTLQVALEYLRRLVEKCSESGYTRILLDRDVPAMMSEADLFDATKYFLEITEGKRLAVVNRHAPFHANLNFAILVAENRGAESKLFDNIPEAERWLLRRPQTKQVLDLSLMFFVAALPSAPI